MSTQYIPSSKTKVCPLCSTQDQHGDCRITEAGNIILCHRNQEQSAPMHGYKWLRTSDKGAGWGVWIWEGDKPKKPERKPQEDKAVYDYPARDGCPLIRVHRQKGQQVPFYQSYWVDGQWKTAKHVGDTAKLELRRQVPLYRYAEVQAAIACDEYIIFCEGEKTANAFWSIGVAATTSIAGSKSLDSWGDYSQDLMGAKLVIAPDRDQVGMEYADKVAAKFKDQVVGWLKAYPKSPLWAVTLPKDGGLDAADWIAEGATKEQVLDAIELTDKPAPERNKWHAPEAWNGELGWWLPIKDENGKPTGDRRFEPACNFDFVIERELSGFDGDCGLVLQVKRSFDDDGGQRRVVLRSLDHIDVKAFENAIIKAFGMGVVCNLKSTALKSLIHTKLVEYRDRGGQIFALADRVGQQEGGTWVFADEQMQVDGEVTAETESLTVFNPNLGVEVKTPSPKLAKRDPLALYNLVEAMHRFHGEANIEPAMLMLGAVAMGLHYQTIMKVEGRFPLVNAIGDPGTNKTVAAINALSLTGMQDCGVLHKISTPAIYETLKRLGGLSIVLDDPEKSKDLDEMLKGLYNGAPRRVYENFQEPHSSLIITSNHACGDSQPATLSRLIQIPFFKSKGGDPSAWDDMKEAMKNASGCLPELIHLGYPQAEVRAMANELRPYLPHAHGRLPDSLGLITYYTIAVARLAGFDPERIKRYVIGTLCRMANDADSQGDTLVDFIDKLIALQQNSLIGEWNCRVVETQQIGRAIAVNMSGVWAELEQKFHPTYSRKVVEMLVEKAGGIVRTTQQFHRNKSESQNYARLMMGYRGNDSGSGEADYDNLPNPPVMKTARCLLIPAAIAADFIAHPHDPFEEKTEPSFEVSSPFSSPGSPPITISSPLNGDGGNADPDGLTTTTTNLDHQKKESSVPREKSGGVHDAQEGALEKNDRSSSENGDRGSITGQNTDPVSDSVITKNGDEMVMECDGAAQKGDRKSQIGLLEEDDYETLPDDWEGEY